MDEQSYLNNSQNPNKYRVILPMSSDSATSDFIPAAAEHRSKLKVHYGFQKDEHKPPFEIELKICQN